MRTLLFFLRFALIPALAACLLTGCGKASTPPSPPPAAAGTGAAGMIHQTGLVRLKNPGDARERRQIIDAVHAFGREIPEVKSAVAGPADGTGGPFCDPGWDVCFILSFEDEAARQRYNAHPVHEKAAREVFLPLSEKLLFYRFVSE